MIVILFRNRLRAGVDLTAYLAHAAALYEVVRQMPGFLSSEDFSGDDGERLSVIAFKDEDSLSAWRQHPEHRAAQAQGRAEYYESYSLQICHLQRESSFRTALTVASEDA